VVHPVLAHHDGPLRENCVQALQSALSLAEDWACLTAISENPKGAASQY